MARRKAPHIPNELLDQLLSGTDAAAALQHGGLLDDLKKALAERALNAEMDHHLAGEGGAGNSRNGYGRKSVVTDTRPPAAPQPGVRLLEGSPSRGGGAEGHLPRGGPRRRQCRADGLRGRALGPEVRGHRPELAARLERGGAVLRLPRRGPPDLDTTNAIEALNAKLRSAVRARGHFPN
jgi:hypothetical protein